LSGVTGKSTLKEHFRTGPVENINGFNIATRTYKDEVMCEILEIMMRENQISEKDFSMIDETAFCLQEWVNDNHEDFNALVSEYENNDERQQYCAENAYSKYFRKNNILADQGGDLMNEAKKSEFEKLKDNKVPLTDEERDKVMDAEAVWHHGPNGKPSPAVWKSVNEKGKVTFVTHTHRAYNTAKTLKGAISRFHKFIKETA
jgi:hypothetical protein